ncbi:nucleotide sugar dehydrogenase [Solwaraspora sp. WMMD792]|uniref:nucleotide sugar dehydrogenase n=1 Tax=Solwaraspora sp. WMMD792 TaxID=3016099 RepID=UPI002417ED53|nr:nucleotide sugar dehydrogenase [Solwaraspora sp. WMMD792]MDG4772409.1 nucleotide sugar dehydrogenase [Solwaraspora sp. WMMD792]
MVNRIGIVGMGYVGLTLAAGLARNGFEVHGVDSEPRVREALSAGRVHLYEPGLAEALRDTLGRNLFVHPTLPPDLDAAVICVSTPVREGTSTPVRHGTSTPVRDGTRQPDLTNVAAAATEIARRCGPQTLVVVRSTVPVGTSRRVVLPALTAAWGRARLVMAPERTIQGQALRELTELPQVVGGLDDDSRRAGVALFGRLVRQVVPVSSLETAELVKLANNCHTDLIYAYGNEIALLAGAHGVDPLEVVRAANHDYPRPDLARPGFVGGSCLSKDPYLFGASAPAHTPLLVAAARQRNEQLPVQVAETVIGRLRQLRGATAGATLAVLGWAYKGWPPTDDMRGAAVVAMLPAFDRAGLRVLGHDPLVADEVIRAHGGEPVSLDKAFSEADAVLVLNDHPDYRGLPVGTLLPGTAVRFVYDSWRILDEESVRAAGVHYESLGYRSTREPV